MRWFYLFVSLATSILLSACSGSQSTVAVNIPSFDLQCSSSQSSNCSILGHSKIFRVGIVEGSLGTDCSLHIRQAGSDFFSNFSISGEVSAEFSASSGLLQGSVTSWVDTLNATTTSLKTGPHTICAYLDINSNGLLNTGEPVSSKTVSSLGINQLMSGWSVSD